MRRARDGREKRYDDPREQIRGVPCSGGSGSLFAKSALKKRFRTGLPSDEAIRLANDSAYGLGSSVYTHNVKWIHRAAQEIEAGMTWVNQLHFGYDELPFGGVKDSGIGREHGKEAIELYLEQKSVVIGGLD